MAMKEPFEFDQEDTVFLHANQWKHKVGTNNYELVADSIVNIVLLPIKGHFCHSVNNWKVISPF